MPLLPAKPADTEPAWTGAAAWPSATPLRRLAAACGVLVVAAELAVAPVTLGCTLMMIGIARVTRWPPSWLVLPTLASFGWAMLVGPGRAADGLATAGVHVVAYLAAAGSVPAHLASLPEAVSRWRAALVGQLPLAWLAAAAQAAVAGQIRDRLGPGRSRSPYRPGLAAVARRGYVTAMVRRGEVATADGACLGLDRDTGRPTVLSWAEAAEAVLITGRDPAAVGQTGLALVVAAIQHRKAVIIVDLADSPGPVAAAVAAVCSDRQAPLRTLPRGTGSARTTCADGGRLAEVLAKRQVLLARPGSRGPEAASELAHLVAAELTVALAERQVLGVPADGLAWFSCCERAGAETLRALLAWPRQVGVPLVLGTSSGPVAGWLAREVGAIVVRGRPPCDGPGRQAGDWPDGRPEGRESPGRQDGGTAELPERLLDGRLDDDLSLYVRGPAPRLRTGCLAVNWASGRRAEPST